MRQRPAHLAARRSFASIVVLAIGLQAALLGAPLTVSAAGPPQEKWTGCGIAPNNGVWSNGANWSLGRAPQAGDDVDFPQAQLCPSPSTLLDDVANLSIDQLTFEHQADTIQAGSGVTLGMNPTSQTSQGIDIVGNSVDLEVPIVVNDDSNTLPLTAETAGTTLTMGGVISDFTGTHSGIVSSGPGTVLLAAANTFTGATVDGTGPLKLGVDNAIPTGSSLLTVSTGATLDLNNHSTGSGLLGGAGNVLLGSGTLTTGGASTSPSTFSGTMSGTGGLVKTGPAVLFLKGTNTYTGPTTIIGTGGASPSGGISIAAGPMAIPSAFTLQAGARIDMPTLPNSVPDKLTIAALSGDPLTSVTMGDMSAILTIDSDTPGNFSGVISGPGAVRKFGSGTETFSGVNTYTGPTSIIAGTLATGIDNAIATSSVLTVTNGTTFSLNGHSESVMELKGSAGTIALGAGGALTENNTSTPTMGDLITTFGGAITGDAGSSVTKTGAGTQLILNGTSHGFLGTARANGGDLEIDGAIGGLAQSIGGTLSGVGPFQNVATTGSSAIFDPGPTPPAVGSTTANAVNLVGGTYGVTFAGSAPGTGFDQLVASGPLTLSSGSTAGTLTGAMAGGFLPHVGDTFTIIQASTVSGKFGNAGDTVVMGPVTFGITYTAGSVLLTVQAVAHATTTRLDPGSQCGAPGGEPLGGTQGNAAVTCNAIVTDIGSPSPSVPSGVITFKTTGSGHFTPPSCDSTIMPAQAATAGPGAAPNTLTCKQVVSYVGSTGDILGATYTHAPATDPHVDSDSWLPTTTTVSCDPNGNPVPVNGTIVCTALITDISASPINPTGDSTKAGNVHFSSDGAGTFSSPSSSTPNVCVPQPSSNASQASCAILFSPSATGVQHISAIFGNSGSTKPAASDPNHLSSASGGPGNAVLIVNPRHATTTLACVAVQVNATSACTAQVTDDSNGTASTPTGTVSFGTNASGSFDNTSCALPTPTQGQGPSNTCSVNYTPNVSGPHLITATYGGDTLHGGGPTTFSLAVSQAGTQTAIAVNPPSPQPGDITITFTATVTPATGANPPGGSVGWSDGNTQLGTTVLNLGAGGDQALFSPHLGVGNHSIKATYLGDSNYTSSASTALPYTITPPVPTVLDLSPKMGPATGGTSVTIDGNGFWGGIGHCDVQSVTFGTVAVTAPVTCTSDNIITVVAPPQSGDVTSVEVQVTNSGGPSPLSPGNDSYTYYAAGAFHPLAPFRVLDTRPYPYHVGSIDTTAAYNEYDFPVAGVGGVPSTDVGAVVLNFTITNPQGAGYTTIWPTGGAVPLASDVNYHLGETRPNLVVVGVSFGGRVSFLSSVATDAVVDVEGWFSARTGGPAGLYNPMPPSRIRDTRPQYGGAGPLGPNGSIPIPLAGVGGIPRNGVSAVALTLTESEHSGGNGGYMTVFPSGPGGPPIASNLNFNAGDVVANRVIVQVGPDGSIVVNNANGYTNFIIDVDGWFTDGSSQSQTGLVYAPTGPTRIIDTRGPGYQVGPFPTMVSGGQINYGSLGQPTGAKAMVANVTVTNTRAAGFMTVWPGPAGGQPPAASDLNWAQGATVADLTIVKLGTTDGSVNWANLPLDTRRPGSTDLIVDVEGFFVS